MSQEFKKEQCLAEVLQVLKKHNASVEDAETVFGLAKEKLKKTREAEELLSNMTQEEIHSMFTKCIYLLSEPQKLHEIPELGDGANIFFMMMLLCSYMK